MFACTCYKIELKMCRIVKKATYFINTLKESLNNGNNYDKTIVSKKQLKDDNTDMN